MIKNKCFHYICSSCLFSMHSFCWISKHYKKYQILGGLWIQWACQKKIAELDLYFTQKTHILKLNEKFCVESQSRHPHDSLHSPSSVTRLTERGVVEPTDLTRAARNVVVVVLFLCYTNKIRLIWMLPTVKLIFKTFLLVYISCQFLLQNS